MIRAPPSSRPAVVLRHHLPDHRHLVRGTVNHQGPAWTLGCQALFPWKVVIVTGYPELPRIVRRTRLDTGFLLLMIALEILFNVSHQELSYRVSRGTAITLAQTREDGREIFAAIRKFYDKRSKLVHTGEAPVDAEDVIGLRAYVRRALLAVGELKLPKGELGKRLDAGGFSDSLATP